MGNIFLEAALKYAGMGLSVIPCNPSMKEERGKKALVKWEKYQKERAGEGQIREWWGKWPKAMIGAVTGEISGIFAVDADTEEAKEQLNTVLPESLLTPTTKSPHGVHNLLKYHPGIRNYNKGNGEIKFHVRGEGGYIIVPPSQRENGLAYAWLVDPFSTAFAEAPIELVNKINKCLYVYGENGEKRNKAQQEQQGVTISFDYPGRDESLFHVAWMLARGGEHEANIRYVLENIAKNCNPPFPEKEMALKIKSALDRRKKRERNWQAEVEDFLSVTERNISVTEAQQALQSVTREEKSAVRMAFYRLKGKIIEPVGEREGVYRRINKDLKIMDLKHANKDEFEVTLPLDLGSKVLIRPKNIIIIAGVKSGYKTTFLLNVVMNNMNRYEIDYLNYEMGEVEFAARLDYFNEEFGMKIDDWKFRAIKAMENFHDFVDESKKIWIVDYMQDLEKPWLVAKQIEKIHSKLKDGICFISLQKATGARWARGGEYTRQISRLYLTLERIGEKNIIKIDDAKEYRRENPSGLIREYKVQSWAKYIPQTPWYTEDEQDILKTERKGKDRWS